MFRAVIGILVVATLVGVMMPAGPGPAASEQPRATADPWFAETSSVVSSDNGGASEVRLTRRRDGHFYADVDVNGTALEFMIDTGATGIALTEDDARRAGVRLDASDRTYVGEGAGGPLKGRRVTLDRVRLGSEGSSAIDAVVIDGASTNLLGQSFLSRFAEVTVRGDVMTMR